jgi:hypothetical protein
MVENPLSVALQLHKAGWETIGPKAGSDVLYIFHPKTKKVQVGNTAMWKALRNLGQHEQKESNKRGVSTLQPGLETPSK